MEVKLVKAGVEWGVNESKVSESAGLVGEGGGNVGLKKKKMEKGRFGKAWRV